MATTTSAPTSPKPSVSYLRVSTARQGQSGLGLEAQRTAVARFLESRACEDLIEEYVEVESGSRSARPELQKALAACRLHGAPLVVAKLNRPGGGVGVGPDAQADRGAVGHGARTLGAGRRRPGQQRVKAVCP